MFINDTRNRTIGRVLFNGIKTCIYGLKEVGFNYKQSEKDERENGQKNETKNT